VINSIKKKITSKVLRLLQIILVPKFEQMLIQIGKQSTFLMLQNNISPKKTTDVGFKVFSQFDEDGILTFLVNKLQLDELTVFEIGAGDFSECNSRWLVENFGAKSVVVDCDPLLQRNIEIMGYRQKNDVLVIQEWVDLDSIQKIESKAREFLRHIDIVSIDLDGIDYWIAKQLSFLDVKIAVVEVNPIFGSTKSITVPYSKNFVRQNAHYSQLYFGCSVRFLTSLSLKLYFCLMMLISNFFFAQIDRVGLVHQHPNSDFYET